MVSHHHTKVGDHRRCRSGHMFLVVEEQDSTSAIAVYPYRAWLESTQDLSSPHCILTL